MYCEHFPVLTWYYPCHNKTPILSYLKSNLLNICTHTLTLQSAIMTCPISYTSSFLKHNTWQDTRKHTRQLDHPTKWRIFNAVPRIKKVVALISGTTNKTSVQPFFPHPGHSPQKIPICYITRPYIYNGCSSSVLSTLKLMEIPPCPLI